MVFVLALLGMVCWGITPLFVKLGLRDIPPQIGLFIRTLFTAGIISSWIFFSGNLGEMKKIPSNAIILLGIEALLATVIGDLAYFAAIKKGEASLVTIILASSPLVTILSSILFLDEKITVSRMIGCFLVITGIILSVENTA